MDIGFQALILLPIGLGLLGFVEPCTVGAHLMFVRSLEGRTRDGRIAASILFVAVRALTTGSVGILAALLGQILFSAQSTIWLAFGVVYTLLGLAYLSNQAAALKTAIRLAPKSLRATRNPAVLGFIFGLNIPACAAPVLFGLIAAAASMGSVVRGFAVMALFGVALSLPLVVLIMVPRLSVVIDKILQDNSRVRLILGALFVILGPWSIWFGLNVDPESWAKM